MTRLPIRLRLVVGFAVALALLLALAATFVFWRVRISLDRRLDQDLRAQSSDLVQAARRLPPGAALASLRDEAREAQLYRGDGTVLASGPGIERGDRLLTPAQVRAATEGPLRAHGGNLLTRRGAVRVLAVPVNGGVAAMAVRIDQRDEALRELLAQLAIGNALALLIASGLGYRFARAALDPVERYRRQAEAITHGAAGVRLDVPAEPRDELTRLGETLNGMIHALEQAAERERHFIDDASHELRTPLTTLAAEIAVALRRPRTPEEYEASLRRLERTTGELLELAETLLSLGALGSGATPHEPVRVDELVRAAAEERGLAASVEELSVQGDRALLARALGNLVENALRHGGGEVELAARRRDGWVELAVHDAGTIEPAFLEHAAERFRRHESSRSTAGAGLGLALVDAIVLAHGGQLRICSGGAHHRRPPGDPALDDVPCDHAEDGTTLAILLAQST